MGCGPAGLLAALEARKNGRRVIAIDKGIIGNDSAAIGAKQLAASGPWSRDGDNPDIHLQDTLKSGADINDEKLASILVKKASQVILELERIGMPFERDEAGALEVSGPLPGHCRSRCLYFGDITGKLLVETIHAECRRKSVELYSEHVAVEILMGEEGAAGALVMDLVQGELIGVRAKAVVIATGGIGRMYELTSNPVQNTGDGIAMALRAGAELMDLEFVQFYPVTVLFPPAIRGMNLNSQHYGAQLINSRGERFMAKYYPDQMEHVTRDQMSQSIFQEILAGNCGPHEGIYVNATMIPKKVYAEKIPTEWDLATRAGIDLTQDMLEVAPSAHYYMGGIRIDERCRTTVKGLFVAGECAAGVQGANRLANNGLTEALVFGSVAGQEAARYSAKAKLPVIREKDMKTQLSSLRKSFSRKGQEPDEIIGKTQRTMTRHMGIVRDEQSMERGLELLNELAKKTLAVDLEKRWSPRSLKGLTCRNMVLLGQAMSLSALARAESRGAHYRSDYPIRDDENWKVNLIVKASSQGELEVCRQEVGARGEIDWEHTR